MRRALIPILIGLIALGGCKPNLEASVPGTWKYTTAKASVTFKSDKTFSQDMGFGITATGTWTIDNGDLVMTPLMIGTKTIAEAKKAAVALAKRLGTSKQAQDFADDLDKPNIMTISADGKSMTTDKTRDTNSGPSQTLTKQGS